MRRESVLVLVLLLTGCTRHGTFHSSPSTSAAQMQPNQPPAQREITTVSDRQVEAIAESRSPLPIPPPVEKDLSEPGVISRNELSSLPRRNVTLQHSQCEVTDTGTGQSYRSYTETENGRITKHEVWEIATPTDPMPGAGDYTRGRQPVPLIPRVTTSWR